MVTVGVEKTPKIHVMQAIHALQHGGSERLVASIVPRLDCTRFRSSVCAIDGGGPLQADFERMSVPVLIGCRQPGLDYRLLMRLWRFFRSSTIDVVQTHHVTQLIYAGLAARLAGVRVVHAEHEYFTLMAPKPRRMLRLLSSACDVVVGVSDSVVEYLRKSVVIAPHKLRTVYNGVDLQRFTPAAKTSREEVGLGNGQPVIGHVGRLDSAKDQDTLLDAFACVRRGRPDARLVIVGDGPLRDDLQARAERLGISRGVTFLGARTDVHDLLPHFDVFVLSSIHEGLPIAMLEAMACARPVVATSVGEIGRVLGRRNAGRLVSPGDAKTLAETIEAVVASPDHATSMGLRAREIVEAEYDLDVTVRRYADIYHSVIAHHRSKPSTADGQLAGRDRRHTCAE